MVKNVGAFSSIDRGIVYLSTSLIYFLLVSKQIKVNTSAWAGPQAHLQEPLSHGLLEEW
jgi:hypothetical protein